MLCSKPVMMNTHFFLNEAYWKYLCAQEVFSEYRASAFLFLLLLLTPRTQSSHSPLHTPFQSPFLEGLSALAGFPSFVRVCLSTAGKNSLYSSLRAFLIFNTVTETQHHHRDSVYFSVIFFWCQFQMPLGLCQVQ